MLTDGRTITNVEELAKLFNKHFISIAEKSA